jgi:hypothetical protein
MLTRTADEVAKRRIDRRVHDSVRRVAALLSIGLVGFACTTASRPPVESPPRVKDSAPERSAALRAASGNLRLEEEGDRWGIEAARERRTSSDPKGEPSSVSVPSSRGDIQVQPPLPKEVP